jgi:biotin carboxyl carrier protein
MENSPAFKVSVNDLEFNLDKQSLEQADILQISPDFFHIIHNHKTYKAEIRQNTRSAKQLEIEMDGEIYAIEIKDALDIKLDQMGFKTVSARQIKEIKAPMPGLVLEVVVKPGQEVAEGQKLLILSAMKMENSILIHATAIIKKVCVAPGDAVEKGQVLIELE